MHRTASVRRHPSARRVLWDSAVALLAGCAALAVFMSSLTAQAAGSFSRTLLSGTVMAVALLVHWVLLAVGARRLGQSMGVWVGLSVMLFPVGGLASLLVLGWPLRAHSPRPQAA